MTGIRFSANGNFRFKSETPPCHPESPAAIGFLTKPSPANNPQQSWGFEGEPPEAVMKDSRTRIGLYEEASFSCSWSSCLSAIS
jgi:hypothetical protein